MAFLSMIIFLPLTLKSIFQQGLPQMVIVRVSGESEADILNALLGGYDADTDKYSGETVNLNGVEVPQGV